MNLNRFMHRMSSLSVVLLALVLPAAVPAQDVEQVLDDAFPPQSITTVERANEALKQVPVARGEIAGRSLRDKADCYQRFLVTSCLNKVNDRERKAMKMVRRVEVEANALLRKEKAAQRDRAVAEREQRAAEQRAKAITITGATRDGESAYTTPDAEQGSNPTPDTNDAGR